MDLRGRRVVIVVGGALHLLVCALYLSADTLGAWLVAIRIAHGVIQAALFAALFAFGADVVPAARRIEGIALFGIGGLLPMSLGGVLGDIVLAWAGYREMFWCATLAAGLGFVVSFSLRDPSAVHEAPPRGLWAAVIQPDLLPLWGAGFLFATGLAAHFTFLKTYLLDTRIGSVGLFFTTYTAAAVGLRLVGARLPERFGPGPTMIPAMVVLMGGFVLLAIVRNATEVGAAGALCGLGHGFVFPILLGLVVARARSSERGAALAIFTALFDLGLLAGGPLLGMVIDWAGYSAMFLSASGIVGLAILVLLGSRTLARATKTESASRTLGLHG